jgi:hypothetical protein
MLQCVRNVTAPKGASDFAGLTVSLKRYPDTKLEFFQTDGAAEKFAEKVSSAPLSGRVFRAAV